MATIKAVALSEVQINERLRALPGWERDGGTIHKTYSFAEYAEGLAFASTVGVICEGLGHHPDMHVGYRAVTLRFSTHDLGHRLSNLDFIAAARIEAMPNNRRPFYCVDFSCATGESQAATAPEGRVWFLLEYNAQWRPKTLKDNDLPADVQAVIQSHEDWKWLFVKQPGRDTQQITLYVAVLERQALYRFSLDDHTALLDLDLEAVVAGDPAYDAQRVHDPVYAVCTHATRDRSCGRVGVKLQKGLAERAGAENAWQSSHLGGHRFAGTLVVLPLGAVYGYVGVDDLDAIVEATNAGTVVLDKYRGNPLYTNPVQAAEVHLLENAVSPRPTDYKLANVEQAGSSWRVTFEAQGEPRTLTVQQSGDVTVYKSSGDLAAALVPTFAVRGL